MAEEAGYCETIGIDLGTTRSSVAVWDGTKVHVIANESGENTTPSWVTYLAPDSRRVGKAALRAAGKYVGSTVYDSKRIIGRPFCPVLLDEKQGLSWPFDVVDNDGNAAISISVQGEEKVVTPEEVAAAILSYLKKIAEDFIGRPVSKAVITVPAYFSDSQRQATRDAGQIAGLEVRRILNEPTAAALAFGVLQNLSSSSRRESALEELLNPNSAASPPRKSEGAAEENAGTPEGDGGEAELDLAPAAGNPGGEGGVRVEGAEGDGAEGAELLETKNMLVFDFGGGTLDVTIMQICGMTFKVRATDGDMQLGGEDIDALLVNHMVEKFKEKTSIDIENYPDDAKKSKAQIKLKAACAQLKVDLSRLPESELCVDDLIEGESFETSMSREDMELLASHVLDRCVRVLVCSTAYCCDCCCYGCGCRRRHHSGHTSVEGTSCCEVMRRERGEAIAGFDIGGVMTARRGGGCRIYGPG